MQNRIVGFLIIGVAVLIGVIVYLFNTALSTIVSTSCSHGTECPMWGTIETQTTVSIAIMVFIIAIGLYLVFFGKEEKIITRVKTIQAAPMQITPRKPSLENFQKTLKDLNSEEKTVFEKLLQADGSIFQSELVEKSGFDKVKVSRILDRLEGKGILERKRRGMTNVVILKQ